MTKSTAGIVIIFSSVCLSLFVLPAQTVAADGAAGSTQLASIIIKGRLAFEEEWDCQDVVESQAMSNATCDQFKRRFTAKNATGPDVLLRPMGVQMRLTVSENVGIVGKGKKCGEKWVQASEEGYFTAEVPGCGTGKKVVVEGLAPFQHQFIEADNPSQKGAVMAIWPEKDAKNLLNNGIIEWGEFESGVVTNFAAGQIPLAGGAHALPAVSFRKSITEPEPSSPVTLGTLVFFRKQDDFYFNYFRQVASGFQNVLELHRRLKSALAAEGQLSKYYSKIFLNSSSLGATFAFSSPNSNWENLYLVNYSTEWAYGKKGQISFFGPYKDKLGDDPMDQAYVISDVGTIAHEFGHSVHAGMASGSFFLGDYMFASSMRRPNPLPSDYAPPGSFKDLDAFNKAIAAKSAKHPEYGEFGHSGGQLQELGTAFVEGVASTIGQYLLNQCNEWKMFRWPAGGPFGFKNSDYSGDFLCDKKDWCRGHTVRHHLIKREVSEGSIEWSDRVKRLQDLAAFGHDLGQTAHSVTTNAESRISQALCDVLDKDTNVAHAKPTAYAKYLPNYTYWVAEIFDGKKPIIGPTIGLPAVSQPVQQTWLGFPKPEDVQVPFGKFLDAMATFCPDCKALPNAAGSKYNSYRLSATDGVISPIAFMKKLVDMGQITPEQAGNLLRTNFMETGNFPVPALPDPPSGHSQWRKAFYLEPMPYGGTVSRTYYQGVYEGDPTIVLSAKLGEMYGYPGKCFVEFNVNGSVTKGESILASKEFRLTTVLPPQIYFWQTRTICDGGFKSDWTWPQFSIVGGMAAHFQIEKTCPETQVNWAPEKPGQLQAVHVSTSTQGPKYQLKMNAWNCLYFNQKSNDGLEVEIKFTKGVSEKQTGLLITPDDPQKSVGGQAVFDVTLPFQLVSSINTTGNKKTVYEWEARAARVMSSGRRVWGPIAKGPDITVESSGSNLNPTLPADAKPNALPDDAGALPFEKEAAQRKVQEAVKEAPPQIPFKIPGGNR